MNIIKIAAIFLLIASIIELIQNLYWFIKNFNWWLEDNPIGGLLNLFGFSMPLALIFLSIALLIKKMK